jgi:peptidylprolyl isomerase
MSTPPSRTQKRQRQKEGAQARRAAELAAARRQQRTRRIVRIVIFAGVSGALVLAMSVFGGKDKKDDTASSTSSTTSASTSTTVAPADVEPPTCAGPDGSNTDLTKKPTVPVPDKKAAELTCRDLVVGTGKEVKPGDSVTVQYVGVSQSTGKQFDASWDRGEPFTANLAGGVIKGWIDGIPGMKVGGRRMLVIPGGQAYGPEGRPPDIGPDDTLVFIVDAQDTKSA